MSRRDDVVNPVKIEGSCVFCPCGQRIELDVETLTAERVSLIRCPDCIKRVRVPARGARGTPP